MGLPYRITASERAAFADTEQAKTERDEAIDALAALHNCIVWSDSYGQFVVAFPGHMPEVLNQVRPVLEKHGRRVF
jgi:hypothetical protein